MDSELLNEFLLEAFPNPERIGCPDEGTLKALAEGRLPVSDPSGLHVGSCSECYAEYRHYRLDWQESQNGLSSNSAAARVQAEVDPLPLVVTPKRSSGRFMGTLLALAASILIIFGAAYMYLSQRHPSQTEQVASSVPVNASVDLFNAPTLRGTGDDAAPLQQVMLPAAIVHLSITLPRFSHAGDYKVVVSYDRTGQKQVAEGTGTAKESDGKVDLGVILDLRAAKAGAYFLATVRGSDNGTYYYPLQVR